MLRHEHPILTLVYQVPEKEVLHMKTCYVNYETGSIADLVKPGELTPHWTIARIDVPANLRGQGSGSNLLDLILADADAEGSALALEVMPSGGLDYESLQGWYERHGFKPTRQGYMLRNPN